MSSNPALVSSFRYVTAIPPGAAHDTVVQSLRQHDNAITDLETSVPLLKDQIDELKTSVASATATETITENVTANPFPGLGTVNDESTETSYTTQTSDNGILLIFSDASAVAVTLNSTVTTPWFCFAENWGAGLVTFTPQSGTISYIGNLTAGSMPLLQGYLTMIVFDGTNFWGATLPVVPLNAPAIAHEWIDAYNAATGVFSQTQPAFTDISGTLQAGQLLNGTTTSLGGSLMTPGQSITVTVAIVGATTAMVAATSPETYPGDGFLWDAYVSGADTVTVRVTSTVTGTPNASLYNVRVLQ